jgi:hypothetical protein
MKPRFSVRALPGAWLFGFLVLISVLRATEADLAPLRAKAEIGNAIAQYNLGLAYAAGRVVPKDPIEAYVWLSLAAENGATGKALSILADKMSDDQLRSAKSRLEERRGVISTRLLAQAHGALEVTPAAADTPVVSETSPVAPAPVVSVPAVVDRTAALKKELATLRGNNVKLGEEVASVRKELDSAKAAAAAVEQRAGQAEAALGLRTKEIIDLQAERDQLRQQLAAAPAAAGSPPPRREPDDQAKALAAAQAGQAKAAALAAQQLEQAQATIARLQAENADLKAKPTLPAATPTPAPAVAAEGSADELTRLKQELARARETVEMTVRSYALIRQENERLKAQVAKIQPVPAVASP